MEIKKSLTGQIKKSLKIFLVLAALLLIPAGGTASFLTAPISVQAAPAPEDAAEDAEAAEADSGKEENNFLIFFFAGILILIAVVAAVVTVIISGSSAVIVEEDEE